MTDKILVLVADGGKARLLTADADGIVEQCCYESPEGRAGARKLATHREPSVHESMGFARHGHQPHTAPRDKYATRFARDLRDAVQAQLRARAYAGIALVASGFGLCIVPESATNLRLPGVRYRRLVRDPLPMVDLSCIYRRDDDSAILQSFLEVGRTFRAE